VRHIHVAANVLVAARGGLDFKGLILNVLADLDLVTVPGPIAPAGHEFAESDLHHTNVITASSACNSKSPLVIRRNQRWAVIANPL
jgi:hypothetical protein